MRYVSTRGHDTALRASQAIVKGIADDGGLFVPAIMPSTGISPCELVGFNYNAHALWLLHRFLTNYSNAELVNCIDGAYNSRTFSAPDIAPITMVDNVAFLELCHGKTLAFKDIALSILPRLMTMALRKAGNEKTQVILTATSGDTGVSALEGFKDVPGTKIIVFYPENGVSVIQKRHMTTMTGSNVHVFGVKGNFDDAQSEVKRLFLNNELKEKIAADGFEFSSANSINIGRLIPQMVYYFHAYSQLIRGGMTSGDAVNFIVPTGNFGNILAGYYAKKMGLPIDKLICASNSNKVLFDYFDTGVFDSSRPFNITSSPSMDILVPSNFERLVYDLCRHDLKGRLEKLSAKEQFQMDVPKDFVGFFATEAEVRDAIKHVFTEHKYLIDPHTAVAYIAYEKFRGANGRDAGMGAKGNEGKNIIISTASPYKFAKTVMTSLDSSYEKYDDFDLLEKMAEVTKGHVPPQFEGLRTRQVIHKQAIGVNEMESAVLKVLGTTPATE